MSPDYSWLMSLNSEVCDSGFDRTLAEIVGETLWDSRT